MFAEDDTELIEGQFTGGDEDESVFEPGLDDIGGDEPDLDDAEAVLDLAEDGALVDDEGEDDGEEGGDDDETDEDGEPKKRKLTKEEEAAEDDLPKHPNTVVPTEKAMLTALKWAFDAEENVPEDLLQRYSEHARLLLKTNRELNLTTVIETKDVAAKLYLDCWRLTRLLPLMAKTVLDLGSGGGFPGIPLALAEPMLSMVLCEDREKKVAYLENCVSELGIKNVRVVGERAEDWLANNKVNMVVVRNVSSVRENIRTLRKVRHNLRDYVMIKGTSWSRELRAAEREAERLGFRLDTVWEHDLPEEMGHRVVLVYRAPGGMGR